MGIHPGRIWQFRHPGPQERRGLGRRVAEFFVSQPATLDGASSMWKGG